MSKTTKRKSSSDSKRRSSSIGAREKRLSVFDRLGTKAVPVEPPLCRHNIYHAYCPACRSSNSQLAPHSLSSSVKRSSKKESDLRPSAEKGSPETDWADWDQSELEYQDEKVLERRRQLLQRELELQMSSDLSPKHNNNIKRKSSSSSSCSSSSSLSSSSSSNSSSQKINSKKLNPSSPDRISSNNKRLSKMVYKENSPGRKLNKKSPGSKMFKKSLSPCQVGSSRKSPSKRVLSRKKGLGRDRSKPRSISRERRRERSKEGRHRSRMPHSSSQRSSERKKDDERGRRDESRRDRRSDGRDSRRNVDEEMRIREKIREKERCRDRDSVRRDKCGRGSRLSHQSRTKEQGGYIRHDSSRHSPLSPAAYHHHYRGERGRYGSNERERSSVYKELSPAEQESRIRTPHPSSSNNYPSDPNRMRRRGGGWEGGRYDSPKSSKDWDSTNDRIQEWQRSSKHSQDKEFSSLVDKEKDVDWKRGGGMSSGRDTDDGIQTKRVRLDDHPPPPPPPHVINEPDLSDISDDPDDILNQDDVEESLEESSRPDVVDQAMESFKEEESLPPLSTASSNLEQRLLDPRIGEEEGMDSLDFEEISDEELEEESKNNKGGCDVLGVDWASFIAECHVEKKSTQLEISSGKPWDTNNVLRRIGLSKEYAGEKLFNSIQKQLTQDGGEGLQSEVGGMHSAILERRKLTLLTPSDKLAISARTDLAYRRKLCGLPVVGIENYPLYQYQTV